MNRSIDRTQPARDGLGIGLLVLILSTLAAYACTVIWALATPADNVGALKRVSARIKFLPVLRETALPLWSTQWRWSGILRTCMCEASATADCQIAATEVALTPYICYQVCQQLALYAVSCSQAGNPNHIRAATAGVAAGTDSVTGTARAHISNDLM